MVDPSRLPTLPKGGSVTAPPRHGIKEQLENGKIYCPWSDFSSWFTWMRNQNAGYWISSIKTDEALQLYQAMGTLTWECHHYHTVIKELQSKEIAS